MGNIIEFTNIYGKTLLGTSRKYDFDIADNQGGVYPLFELVVAFDDSNDFITVLDDAGDSFLIAKDTIVFATEI